MNINKENENIGKTTRTKGLCSMPLRKETLLKMQNFDDGDFDD